MKFEQFERIDEVHGKRCTQQLFMATINSKRVVDTCMKIAAEEDHDKQGVLKRELPAVTWVASYGGKTRAAKNAIPSGLYMVDIDNIPNPDEVWRTIEAKGIEWLGIKAAHKTPSTKGLRVVLLNREGLDTVVANQEWFYAQFPEIEFDRKVKDMARGSYLVPESYFYYLDQNMFEEKCPVYIREGGESSASEAPTSDTKDLGTYKRSKTEEVEWFYVLQSQNLFENKNKVYETADLMYRGKDLRDIVLAWFAQRGGVPNEGDRNQGLFELACDLRYITDFNAELMLACLPAIMDKAETKQAIKSALSRERLTTMPNRLKNVLKGLTAEKKEDVEEEKTSIYDLLQKSTDILPPSKLPPIFRQLVEVAPADFKKATVVALLPMLGTLGSRLRARYIDGVEQTPSFQAEIEAPMASGKSFANRLDEIIMSDVRKKDFTYRKKEAAYQQKVKAAVNKKEQPEVETYPIRIINPTTSVAALLERQQNAGEVHLYSFTDEIKVVLDSMKRGSYGDLRALMRNAFDNQYFGQDYKGDKSTNTMCRIYFNTLHCGTPAEYKKFYDNSEDGTISRIILVELPDQSFKDMPRWNWERFEAKYAGLVSKNVRKLSEVTMKDDEVQPTYELQNFDFINVWAEKWLKRMQKLAKQENNRSLDTFRRRAAVVGFRAAMIAWYLYGKNTKVNRENTIAFAEMVAEQMLVSLLHRYHVSEVSNVIYFKNIWNRLKDEFTTDDLEQVKEEVNVSSETKTIIYRWKEQNLVEKVRKKSYRKKII
ncbi:MAG: DUF3987 domain-containing protein [Bacteroidaceae bacterium]|nr:DUF3987 domain-containing protein [Bacteroidaceae bacterium]